MAPNTSSLIENVGMLTTKQFTQDLVYQIMMGSLRQESGRRRTIQIISDHISFIKHDKNPQTFDIKSFVEAINLHTAKIIEIKNKIDCEPDDEDQLNDDLDELLDEILNKIPILRLMNSYSNQNIKEQIVRFVIEADRVSHIHDEAVWEAGY